MILIDDYNAVKKYIITVFFSRLQTQNSIYNGFWKFSWGKPLAQKEKNQIDVKEL